MTHEDWWCNIDTINIDLTKFEYSFRKLLDYDYSTGGSFLFDVAYTTKVIQLAQDLEALSENVAENVTSLIENGLLFATARDILKTTCTTNYMKTVVADADVINLFVMVVGKWFETQSQGSDKVDVSLPKWFDYQQYQENLYKAVATQNLPSEWDKMNLNKLIYYLQKGV